jgi:DNA-binding ferritin-like protein
LAGRRLRVLKCGHATELEEKPMFDARNDLPANVRTKVIELLNARLADAIDLGTQTKHAHWNVSRETDKDLWFLEAHLHAKR